jgi:hypothetical protein
MPMLVSPFRKDAKEILGQLLNVVPPITVIPSGRDAIPFFYSLR